MMCTKRFLKILKIDRIISIFMKTQKMAFFGLMVHFRAMWYKYKKMRKGHFWGDGSWFQASIYKGSWDNSKKPENVYLGEGYK